MRHRILLAGWLLYLAIADVIWIIRDTRPPFWNMALHAVAALRIYDIFTNSGISALAHIPQSLLALGYPYPPLYQTMIAGLWAVFGKTIEVARLANLLPIAALMLATYGIGRVLLSPWSAALAGIL